MFLQGFELWQQQQQKKNISELSFLKNLFHSTNISSVLISTQTIICIANESHKELEIYPIHHVSIYTRGEFSGQWMQMKSENQVFDAAEGSVKSHIWIFKSFKTAIMYLPCLQTTVWELAPFWTSHEQVACDVPLTPLTRGVCNYIYTKVWTLKMQNSYLLINIVIETFVSKRRETH